jgi:hypothetical protein
MNDFCLNEDNLTNSNNCIFSFNLVFDFIFVQLFLNTNLCRMSIVKFNLNQAYDVANVDIMLLCRSIYTLILINNKYDNIGYRQANHENSLLSIDDLKDDYRYKNFTCLVGFLETFVKSFDSKYLNVKKIRQLLKSTPDYTV